MQLTSDSSPLPCFTQLDETSINKITYSYVDNYHSFDYFNYEQAKRYYVESNAFISEVITTLCYYNDFGLDGSFIDQVNGISKNLLKEEECLVYRYPEGYDKFDMAQDSVSGITQAKLASLFLRAGSIEDAKKCLNGCLLEHDKKGPYRVLAKDMNWIEEYPAKNLTMVLNGHLFVLIALIEYLEVTKDDTFAILLDNCLKATLNMLPKYWKGNDLLYSMDSWDFCNVHYVGIMTYQMEHLYKLTSIENFRVQADRLRSGCNWSIFVKLMRA